MKKLLGTAAVFGLALSLPLSGALAQDDPAIGQPQQLQPMNPMGGANADFDAAVLAMGNATAETTELQGLAEIGTVNVVKVGTEAEHGQAWTDAMSQHQADIDALHTAIEGNASLKAKLDEQAILLDDVLGLDVGADGAITVYVQG
jgi:hypothetical protein